MEMAKNEILAAVVKAIKYHFNLDQSEIAEKTGIKKTYLSDLIGGRSPLSESYSDKLSTIFGVSKDYLRAGEGEIFSGDIKQHNVNGDNINGNNVTVHKSQTDNFLELLKKKDEQIDVLLGIVKNLSK